MGHMTCIIPTSDYRLTDGHLLTTRKLTGLNSRRTQS